MCRFRSKLILVASGVFFGSAGHDDSLAGVL
jgi:hypothetical protein